MGWFSLFCSLRLIGWLLFCPGNIQSLFQVLTCLDNLTYCQTEKDVALRLTTWPWHSIARWASTQTYYLPCTVLQDGPALRLTICHVQYCKTDQHSDLLLAMVQYCKTDQHSDLLLAMYSIARRTSTQTYYWPWYSIARRANIQTYYWPWYSIATQASTYLAMVQYCKTGQHSDLLFAMVQYCNTDQHLFGHGTILQDGPALRLIIWPWYSIAGRASTQTYYLPWYSIARRASTQTYYLPWYSIARRTNTQTYYLPWYSITRWASQSWHWLCKAWHLAG